MGESTTRTILGCACGVAVDPYPGGCGGNFPPLSFGFLCCKRKDHLRSPLLCHRTKRSRPHAETGKIEILKGYDGEAVYAGENEEAEEQDQKGHGRVDAEGPAWGAFVIDF